LFGCRVESAGASRLLRLWLSNFSLFNTSAFRWLVGVSATLVALYWLVTLGTYSPCFTQVLAEVHDLAGFDFETRETDCWHNPAVSVFVAKAGHSTRTRLFQYVRDADSVPVITLVGKNTVQISLSSMEVEHCRRDRWGPLRIKYDIGFVEYPGYFQPAEC
jgi:hypothetical protein